MNSSVILYIIYLFLILFCETGVWNQGFWLAKQVLYHKSHISRPILYFKEKRLQNNLRLQLQLLKKITVFNCLINDSLLVFQIFVHSINFAVGKILRQPQQFPVHDVHTQESICSLSGNKTCECDGISLIWVGGIIYQRGRDSEDELRSPIILLLDNPKVYYTGMGWVRRYEGRG
jgi:hypothetical protein